ncbi:hypothetical protein BT69DRAFT_986943 [Atractiella rhizophila]|nr:hypothetical protein BT69DRAFT_986943 [Atractiella rhizophila]
MQVWRRMILRLGSGGMSCVNWASRFPHPQIPSGEVSYLIPFGYEISWVVWSLQLCFFRRSSFSHPPEPSLQIRLYLLLPRLRKRFTLLQTDQYTSKVTNVILFQHQQRPLFATVTHRIVKLKLTPLDGPANALRQNPITASPEATSDPFHGSRLSPVRQRRRTSVTSLLSTRSSHSSLSISVSPTSRGLGRSYSSSGLLNPSPGSPIGSGSFGSFVGSYENSLLSGRMSAVPPSQPLPFQVDIGVIGTGSNVPKGLKCPPHLNLDFGAQFYNTEDGNGTPYVGTIDIEQHYFDEALGSDISLSNSTSSSSLKPAPSFPGYQIPPKGQLQLIVKNPNRTPVKVFLVPYDLTSMPSGSKTFLRQKSYVVPTSNSGSPPHTPGLEVQQQDGDKITKESLRYAVHLYFCSPPARGTRSSAFKQRSNSNRSVSNSPAHPESASSRPRSSTHDPNNPPRRQRPPKIYLYRTVRVLFASRTPDSNETLKVITETPVGVADSKVADSWSFSRYEGPGENWEHMISGVGLGLPRFENSADYPNVGLGIPSSRALRSVTDPTASSPTINTDRQWMDSAFAQDPNGERWTISQYATSYSTPVSGALITHIQPFTCSFDTTSRQLSHISLPIP